MNSVTLLLVLTSVAAFWLQLAGFVAVSQATRSYASARQSHLKTWPEADALISIATSSVSSSRFLNAQACRLPCGASYLRKEGGDVFSGRFTQHPGRLPVLPYRDGATWYSRPRRSITTFQLAVVPVYRLNATKPPIVSP